MRTTLIIHPIFTGLTRPPMLFGITTDYLFICFVMAYGSFMFTANPFFLTTYLPLHLFGWIACRIDHNFFRVLMTLMTCPNVRNKKVWRSQSYEPF